MKTSNTVVWAVVIAAVLVFAYGVGLLIRQARTGGLPGRTSAEVNETAVRHQGPRTTRTTDTPEARAKIKEGRAKTLEKLNLATDEEKQKIREQVVKQVTGRRGGKGRVKLPSQEKTQTTGTPSPTTGAEVKQDPNTPAAGGRSPETKQGSPQAGAEPGRAGPN